MGLAHHVDRWPYRGKHPNRLARLINGASAGLASRGLAPARLVRLEVTGRRTGRTVRFPVVVADYRGDQYLVSMLGEDTNWVRNVRAAGGGRCWPTAAARRFTWRKWIRRSGLRSCAVTWNAPRGPGRTSRSTGGRRFGTSTRSPGVTPSSASQRRRPANPKTGTGGLR
jgi:F420H(2)-dependent quinone reductase